MSYPKAHSAFTLIEVIAAVAIIGILVAVLIVGIGKARVAAWRAQSISNIRQLHGYTMTYTVENKGVLPQAIPASGWVWWRVINGDPTPNPLVTKMTDQAVKKEYPDLLGPTYGLNMFGQPPGTAAPGIALVNITNPSRTVLFSLASPMAYSPAWYGYGNGTAATGWPSRPYNNNTIVGFVDGHVRMVSGNSLNVSGIDLEPEAWLP